MINLPAAIAAARAGRKVKIRCPNTQGHKHALGASAGEGDVVCNTHVRWGFPRGRALTTAFVRLLPRERDQRELSAGAPWQVHTAGRQAGLRA